MSILDKKGIGVTSGFKLVSGAPIDARFTAEDEIDLQSLIDNGAVYNGLEVWVNSLGKKKMYNGTEFVDVATGGSSGGSGSSGNVFVEVDNLPESPDQNTIYKKRTLPTQLPTPGEFVDTIYFNTTKSPTEIMGTLAQDNIFWVDGSLVDAPGYSFCPILCFDGSDQPAFWNDPVVILTFLKNSSDTYYLSFQGFTTGNALDLWSSNSGWRVPSNFVIKKNSMASVQGLPIGTSNSLLNDILNSNGVFTPKVEYFVWDSVGSQWSTPSMLDVPFIPSNAIQGAIYRVQNNTPIHSDGYLGSIKFNKLYIGDVVKMFDSLTDWIYLDESQTTGMYIIFADVSFSNLLLIQKATVEGANNIYYLQLMLYDESSGETIDKLIFSNDPQDYDWKIDSTEVIEINKKGCALISKEICEQLGSPVPNDIVVGSENDKLQYLILNASGFYTILSDKIYPLGTGSQKISVDNSVIIGSKNPVSGNAVYNYISGNTAQSVTSGNRNPVSSSAVYSHVETTKTSLLNTVNNTINNSKVTVDKTMSSTSSNPVANYVVKQYVDSKATTITVDSAMSSTSTRPVQNRIIKQYVDNKETELKQYVEDTINNLVERYYS